jgi:ankyrin repeat protein
MLHANRCKEKENMFPAIKRPSRCELGALLFFVLLGAWPLATRGAEPENDFFRICSKGTLEDVRKALIIGVNIHARDGQGMTALMYAARDNADPEVMKVLLRAAAPRRPWYKLGGEVAVEDRDKEGRTALMFAVENNSPDVVGVLLDAGADVNARDKRDMTVLMRAVTHKSGSKVVEMLLDAGADVNVAGTSGVTALMLAASKNPDLDVVRALLKSGADACAKDVIGHDALWYAQVSRRERGQKEQLLRMLRESASR